MKLFCEVFDLVGIGWVDGPLIIMLVWVPIMTTWVVKKDGIKALGS